MNARPLTQRIRPTGLSRRSILGRFGAGGLAAGLLTVVGHDRAFGAQEGTPVTPAGWQAVHMEVDFTPQDPVSITLAGGGPPQRGDAFYISAPIFAAGDIDGTQIGTYQCFGHWTASAESTDEPNLRLTTVWFQLSDGNIAGLINELGASTDQVGAVQGGTGSYTAALGTFRQLDVPADEVPGGTPEARPVMVRAAFDLLLPQAG